MKALCIPLAACLAIGCAPARAEGPDEAKVREALHTQVDIYLATTREDLKSDARYPKLEVNLISSSMAPGGSLVNPYTAEVRYSLEYDDTRSKGDRDVHPFLLKASYFDGRWDISAHGHREMKNVKDLDPKASKILFPNI